MKNKKLLLPHLPFGSLNSTTESDIFSFSDKMAKVITSLKYYDAIGDQKIFQSKTFTLSNGDFKVVASANTPVSISVDSTDDITLMIPFYGENLSVIDNDSFKWRAGENAILLPKVGRSGSSSTRATLTINIDPQKIEKIAKSMLGIKEDIFLDLKLNEPRLISMWYGEISFEQIFRHLCGFIDIYKTDTNVLFKLGVDDMFYRNIVMMLLPEKFFNNTPTPNTTSSKAINKIIEFRANFPTILLNLSDLERISGLGARALQYEFQKQFQCSPLQWLKKQRLHIARQILQDTNNQQNITQIAISLGFANSSLFSKYYQIEFGELPSQTFKKK